MKKLLNNHEWEQLLEEHPELAEDLEEFFRGEERGVAAVVGFYTTLKMRLWRFLSWQKKAADKAEAQSDEAPPPRGR